MQLAYSLLLSAPVTAMQCVRYRVASGRSFSSSRRPGPATRN